MRVEVVLKGDDGPGRVTVPGDLAEALEADGPAAAAFAGLPDSHRREYVDWITEAKRPETRARRVARTVELLAEGRTSR